MLVNSNIKLLHRNNTEQTEAYKQYRQQWYQRPIDKDPGSFPLFLDLDASTSCNFSCPSCSCTINKYYKRTMNFDLYKQVIDEATENNCYGVKFHTICRGEPLINPNIVDMVDYAKKKGMIDVRMNTNGSLLTPDMIRKLITAGIDMIIFSIDGSNKDEYKKSGRNGNFSELESAVWMTKEYSNKFNRYGKTIVRVQAIAFDWLDKEKFKQKWSKLADEVSIIDYQEMHNRTYKLNSKKWYCPMLFQRLSVLWDGTILPCNLDDRCICDLGKIGQTTIKQAWDSDTMRMIRDINVNGLGECLGLCDGCYLRTNEINKLKGQKND